MDHRTDQYVLKWLNKMKVNGTHTKKKGQQMKQNVLGAQWMLNPVGKIKQKIKRWDMNSLTDKT